MTTEELQETFEKIKTLIDIVTDGGARLFSLFADDEGESVRFSYTDGTTITGAAPVPVDPTRGDVLAALGLQPAPSKPVEPKSVEQRKKVSISKKAKGADTDDTDLGMIEPDSEF